MAIYQQFQHLWIRNPDQISHSPQPQNLPAFLLQMPEPQYMQMLPGQIAGPVWPSVIARRSGSAATAA